MKLQVITTIATNVAVALSLSACASADQTAFYRDIAGCSREYTGAISAGVLQPGSFTGSVHIQCDPLAVTKANAAKIKADAPAGAPDH